MDGIDYTPPTTQEREFLDWALRKHMERLNAERLIFNELDRMERLMADLLDLLQKGK